jgi:hypothetical protein
VQDTGLELLIAFNKKAVVVLPTGINKATGLDYALRKLGLSFHEAVGVGNAENDHSFLSVASVLSRLQMPCLPSAASLPWLHRMKPD